jgi:hypothetical protein
VDRERVCLGRHKRGPGRVSRRVSDRRRSGYCVINNTIRCGHTLVAADRASFVALGDDGYARDASTRFYRGVAL